MLASALQSDESKADIIESFETILAMAANAAAEIDGYELSQRED